MPKGTAFYGREYRSDSRSPFKLGKEFRSPGYIQGSRILLDEIDIYQEVDIDHFLCDLPCFVPCPAVFDYQVCSCDRSVTDRMEFCVREPQYDTESYRIFYRSKRTECPGKVHMPDIRNRQPVLLQQHSNSPADRGFRVHKVIDVMLCYDDIPLDSAFFRRYQDKFQPFGTRTYVSGPVYKFAREIK